MAKTPDKAPTTHHRSKALPIDPDKVPPVPEKDPERRKTAFQEIFAKVPPNKARVRRALSLTGVLVKAVSAAEQRAPKEKWATRDKNRSESPVAFTRRVYAKRLGAGLTRPELRELDPDLYRALYVWIHRHPDDDIPELLSVSEVIDQKIERLAEEFTPDELRKLGLALQARARRMKK